MDRQQQTTLQLQYMPLQELVRAPRNPKQHDIGFLNTSMDEYGYADPVTLDERTHKLVAGHGRLDTLQQRKASGLPAPRYVREDTNGTWLVPVVRGWSSDDDAHAEGYLVADNRSTELGGWDDNELAQALSDLAAQDRLDATGYTSDDLDDLLQLVAPPDLDALSKEYGDPTDEEFWPVLKVKVPPHLETRFNEAVRDTGDQPYKLLQTLLDKMADG